MEIRADGKTFATTLEEENARLREENAQLRASDGQLRLLADFSPALISYVDREERYRFMNRRYTEWFGFESKEVIGKTILEVVGPVAYEKAKTQICEALKGKHTHFENQVVMKSGEPKFVDLQFVPFQDSGQVNGFIILGYDITDLKKAEWALKETQMRLEFALENANMTSWYLDLKTNQVLSTPGSKPLSGYEVERQSLYDMTCAKVHPDDVDHTFKALSESIQEHKPYQHEYRQLQSDGSYRWILSRAMPQYDEGGLPVSISGVMVDITERRQTEDLYRAVTEMTPQFVWIGDAKGAITYSNSTLLNYMGVAQDETFGDRWVETLHPDDREHTIEVWKQSILSGQPYEVEFRVRSKNGSYGWFLNRALPMRDRRDGRIDRWLGVSTDITKLKEIEIALIQSEDRFRTLADSIAQFAWTARPDGYRTWYNQRWYDYTGSKLEEVEGWGWLDFQHPDHKAHVLESYRQSIETGIRWEITLPLREKSGQWRWFLVIAVPIKDSHGSIIRWLGTGTDITEQKQIRENLSFLADASSILSSSLDYNETLQKLANITVPKLASWCSISVIEDGEIPKTIAIAHPDPEMMKIAEEFRTKYPPDWNSDTGVAKVLKTGQSELHSWIPDEVIASVAKDPEHLRLLRLLKIRSVMIVPIQARTQILGILTLVASTDDRRYTETDLAIAEEIGKRAGLAVENARLFTQAQDAVRLRDEFLSIASHELKTPITALKLQLQLNQRRYQKEPRIFSENNTIEKLLNSNSTQVDRLSKLVDEMLDISRISHGKLILSPESVDLGSLVKDVVDRFQEQLAAAGCECQLNIENPVRGQWDRYRMEQVVTNLMTNALKYGAGKPVEISVQAKAKNAVISIKDHGIGIPCESLNKIFGRFERAVTEKNISGLGLGLYISRQIIEAHDGKIQVLSEVGQGSTFSLELPLSR